MGNLARKPDPIEYFDDNECDIFYGDLVFHNPTLDFQNKKHYICYECMMKKIEEITGLDFDKMTYHQCKEAMVPYIKLSSHLGYKLINAD